MPLTIRELQIRLAAFGAGVPDNYPGKNTTMAIKGFQQHVMGDSNPDGIVGPATELALQQAWDKYKPSLADMDCDCGSCSGFGNGKFKNNYREGKPECEAYYNYEYPGISAVTVWIAVMVQAVFPQYQFRYSSGYRCWNDNNAHGRMSTNHMGKACDLRPHYPESSDRNRIVKEVHKQFDKMQVGWSKRNVPSFEPVRISPTWIHADVRCFDRKWIESTLTTDF